MQDRAQRPGPPGRGDGPSANQGSAPAPRPGPNDGLLRARDVRELRQAMHNPPPAGPGRPGPPQPPPVPPAAHQPPAAPVGSGRRDRVVRTGKIVAAVTSVLVLAVTGYGWATFQQLTDNLTTTPVISGGGLAARDGATDILLVGSDSRTDARGNPLSPEVLAQLRAGANEGDLTDTLILVRIPNDGSRAVGISIPRDTFVEIQGGLGQHKINSAFTRAKDAKAAELGDTGAAAPDAGAADEARLAGRRTLVRTVENLTGVGVDHYAEVNLLGFYEITNAIGGIEVCLNRATRDPDSGANFPAGRQTITGGDALAFVRQRKNLPRGDLDRIVRQQVFMSGVADKVLSAGTLASPGKLRSLVTSLQRSIVLDDQLDPLVFAEQMRGIASGAVQFVTIPVLDIDAQTADGSSVTVDEDAVRQFVRDQVAVPLPAGVDKAAITVDVRNATETAGLASRVLAQLAEQGFTAGDTGNATTTAGSSVHFASGDEALADTVAQALGGLPVEQDPELTSGRVRVILGEDYTGPGAQRFAAGPIVRLDGPGLDFTALDGPLARSQPTSEAPITAGDIPCVD